MTPTLKEIRSGLYEIVGVRCGLARNGKTCGGELRTENCGRGEMRWETFCRECKTCDPNGHPTLAAVLKNVGYFKVEAP